MGKLLNLWRAKQKTGAIMQPSTFAGIETKATKKYGAKRGKKIAGAAYWKTAKMKFKKRKKK